MKLFPQITSRTAASTTNCKPFSHRLSCVTSTSWSPQSPNPYTRALRRRGGRVKGKVTRALMFINRLPFFFPIFLLFLSLFDFHPRKNCTLMDKKTNSLNVLIIHPIAYFFLVKTLLLSRLILIPKKILSRYPKTKNL